MKFIQNIRFYFELKTFLAHAPFQLVYNEHKLHQPLAEFCDIRNSIADCCYTLDDKKSPLKFSVRQRSVLDHKTLNIKTNTKLEYSLNVEHNDKVLSGVQKEFYNNDSLAKQVFKLCASQYKQRSQK